MARLMPILAIDEGTTGVTALVLDDDRRIIGRASAELDQTYPKPGWVEQDALQIYDVVVATGRKAMRAARVSAKGIAGVGITNQRETVVLWDRATGRPVAPAIVWQDRRTARTCEQLQPKWGDKVRKSTGLLVDPYFSATKLQWLLHAGPGAEGLLRRARAGELAFGTVDAWLAWKLTGQHATEPTNASRTLLWDIHKGAWDDELLDLFGVPPELLPDVQPSAHPFGKTEAFGGEIQLAALVGDQQAALFGQRCFSAGEAKNTYGTGCFLLQHTGSKAVASSHGLLTTRAASLDDRPRFALEGSVFTAGAAIQWFRDEMGVIKKAADINELAAESPDTGGVFFVPSFTGLGAPYWDPEARGAILGMTRGTSRTHIARAILDSIAFQSTEVLLAMEKDSRMRIPRLRVDGGVSRSAPLLQFQADLLQRPVVRPSNVETTALGAGFLAGLATDAWTLAELRGGSEEETVVTPGMAAGEAKKRLQAWRKAVASVQTFRA